MLLYNLIFGIHLYLSIKQATDAAAKRLTEQVWHYANEIDTYARDLMNMAHSSARLLGRREFTDHVNISGFLTDILRQYQLAHGIKLIWFRSGHGWNIYNAHRDNRQVMIDQMTGSALSSGQVWWLQQQEQGEGFWTDPRGTAKDGWLVSYMVPIYSGSLILGYLVVDVNLANLRKQVIDREMGQPKFSILNGMGQYVQTDSKTARQYNLQSIFESQDVYGTPGLWSDIQALVTSGKPTFRKIWVPMRQHEYWVVGAPIKSGHWWMITHIRREVALESVREQAQVDALIMLLSLVLIFTCACLVSDRISRPASRLKQSMDDFTYRQVKPAIINNSSDEIGSLTDSFQTLIKKLADREQALREARANNIGHLVQRLRGNYFYFNLNREGCVIHVSPSVEAILGYRQGEFLRPLISFLCSENDRLKFRRQLRTALDGKWGDTFELDICSKDGCVHRIEIFWSDMGDTSDRQILIEGLANDITERVSDTKKFKQLLDSAPDATIIATPEGIISMVNTRAEELFGYQREALVNMPLKLLTAPQYRKQHPLLGNLADASWNELCLVEFESHGIDCRGRIFPVDITSNPLKTSDGLLISMVVRDITERKRIEQELTGARDAAEKANRAKGLFLSNMSHELRTPLNGVLGNAQLLLRNRNLSEQDRMVLESIDVSGRHLLSLINDILDMTKIESSEIELNIVPTDLRELLQDVQNILMEKAVGKGLELRLEIQDELPEVIMLDESKVRQVLLNLVSNAVKFTGRGWVKLMAGVRGEKLLLEVSDTGVGIARKDLERVFEPFRQVHASMQMGGTGLGLAISRKLVQVMGGEDLCVSSQEGHGSTFVFDLPLVDGSQAMLADKLRLQGGTIHQSLRDSDRGIPVLVVDDIKSNRDMLAALLISAGFNVSKAGDGRQAIDALLSRQHSLVLMDIRMPVMDGITAIGKIRLMPEISGVRVIAVTASVSHEARDRLLKQGFDDYLAKPLDAGQMFDAIGRLLDISFVEENFSGAWDEDSLLQDLDAGQCCELAGILSSALELGDLQMLEQTLLSQKGICQKSRVLNYLLAMTRDVKIEKLEELASRLQNRDKT